MRLRATILTIVIALGACNALAQNPQPPAPPQGTGRITGVVTRGDTARPVPDATIRVVRWEGGRGQQSAVRTDALGRFVVANALPGSFQLTASAEGLVTMEFGQRVPTEPGKRIELADGQQFEDANIILQRTSAIEGQLLDEFGDPLPNVLVQVATLQFLAGKTRLSPVGATPASDDRGHFRVFGLPPGDYYVMALTGLFAGPEGAAGFAVTYYPGTTTPPDAQAVHVGFGQDKVGLSFAAQPATMANLSGVAVDSEGKPVPGASMTLAATTGDDLRVLMLARNLAGPDGVFNFRNVPYGTYVVQVFGRPVGGNNVVKAPFGALPLTVAGDRNDLRVSINTGAFARGRIVFDDPSAALKPEQVTPGFVPVEFVLSPLAGGPPTSVTRDDWTFEVQNQFGLRVVRPNIAAPGWILKSVTQGGKDVTDVAVDFRKGDVNDLEITLTNRTAAVSGAVTDGEAPAREFTVVVFSEDATKWAFPSRFLAVARPNPAQPGAFRIAGLPSGAYLVAALPSVSGTDYQDPAFLEALRPLTTRVVVNEGDTKAVALRIIKR